MRAATFEGASRVLRQCGNSITMLVQYSPDSKFFFFLILKYFFIQCPDENAYELQQRKPSPIDKSGNETQMTAFCSSDCLLD